MSASRHAKSTDPEEVPDGGTLSKENVFETLSNQRRRYIVHDLLRRESSVDLGPLARRIAAWENGKEVESVTAAERRRVYNALQQTHLPKMDEMEFVEYDRTSGTIDKTDGLRNLKVYLEVIPGDGIPWSVYYLLLGLFCGGFTVAEALGIYPFVLASGVALALGTVCLFVCSAAVHVYHNHRMRLGQSETPPGA